MVSVKQAVGENFRPCKGCVCLVLFVVEGPDSQPKPTHEKLTFELLPQGVIFTSQNW